MVWLDNLFTQTRLFSVLREKGIGAAGTVRTTKIRREEEEESHRTKAQKKKAELNRSLILCLAELKLEPNTQMYSLRDLMQ